LELDDAEALRAKAYEWLLRAADVARQAAASVETRQHVREAMEFASPDDLPRLWELLADSEIGGSVIVETYAKALELAREANRGPNDELRILGRMLTIETRSQGSVANRPSVDEINEIRRQGRELFGRATDDRSKAIFLIAEGFYPFWQQANGRVSSQEEQTQAEADAMLGLELAKQIGDVNLQSAALDALGALAQQRADWETSRRFAEERIAMGSRLVMFEQVDAHAVAAWSSTIMGDLAAADRISAAGLAILQPRQAPDWALHLVAWRIVALALMGKWDEVESTTERAYGFWLESGRPLAGYSMRGFTSALIVAHARRDQARIERWSEVMHEIGSQFGLRRAQNNAIADWDLEALAASLTEERLGSVIGRFDYAATFLTIVSDDRRHVDPTYVESLLAVSRQGSGRILEACVLRHRGVQAADVSDLDRAREIFASAGARPYQARCRCEAAIIRADRNELDAGMAYLESIRDEVQIERYLKAFRDRNG